MFYKTLEFTLKNNKTAAIRSIRPEEAGEMLRHMHKTISETRFMLRLPGDALPTESEMTRMIQEALNDNYEAYLGVFVDHKMVGFGEIYLCGKGVERVTHRCRISLSVEKEYWRQGIGSHLVEALMDMAQRVGYEQIELEVFTDNDAAVKLYEKYGFERYGTRPHAMKDWDGMYHDEHLMVKKLSAKFEPEEKATTDLEEWIEEQGIQLRY